MSTLGKQERGKGNSILEKFNVLDMARVVSVFTLKVDHEELFSKEFRPQLINWQTAKWGKSYKEELDPSDVSERENG